MTLHVIAGGVALVGGPLAMTSRKGGKWHRRAGHAYFWAMALVAGTAVLLALLRSGPFLLLIGIFSFYLAFTGLRAVIRKPPAGTATTLDRAGAGIMLAGAAALLIHAFTHTSPDFRPVAITFAAIGGGFALADLRRFRKPGNDPMEWWFLHMIRMLSAYIATFTAFSVVNLRFLPTAIPWLVPTVIGTCGITLWVNHYKRRFATIKK